MSQHGPTYPPGPGPAHPFPDRAVRPPRPRLRALLVSVAMLGAVLGGAGIGVFAGSDSRRSSAPSSHLSDAVQDAEPAAAAITQTDLDTLAACRSKALDARVRKAFLSTVDPADKALVESQRRVFDNLQRVSFAVQEFQAGKPAGDPVGAFGQPVSVEVDVNFNHQIKGYDLTPVRETYRWRVTRANAAAPPLITGVGGGGPKGSRGYYPAPWDAWTDMQVVQTDRAMILAEPKLLGRANQLSPAVEKAAQDTVANWRAGGQDAEIVDRFVVSFVPSYPAMSSLYDIDALVNTAGHSFSMPSSTRQAFNGGARVVIDASAKVFDPKRMKDVGWLFRHEFTHSMLADLAQPGVTRSVPMRTWVTEGIAEYVANRSFQDAGIRVNDAKWARRHGQPIHLPSNDEWGSDTLGINSYHYYLAHQAMRYMAKRFGESTMYAFIAGYYADADLEGGLRDAIGMSFEKFETDWRQFVQEELRRS